MHKYIQKVKAYVAAQTPNYGVMDAEGILEMLYFCYNEFNGFDNENIKTDFEKLYQQMDGMSLKEIDRIIDLVCMLCQEHQKTGFVEGVKLGVRLAEEIA